MCWSKFQHSKTLHCTSIWLGEFVKWSFENVLLLLLLVEDESRKRMTMLSLEVFVTRTQLSSASNFLSYPKIIIRVNNPLFVKWNWTIFIYFHDDVDVEKVVTKEKDLLSINLSNDHHFQRSYRLIFGCYLCDQPKNEVHPKFNWMKLKTRPLITRVASRSYLSPRGRLFFKQGSLCKWCQ